MPEHDYDRLEQFFRKAASKADVTFNEEDWKKLENRLDAETPGETAINSGRGRVATTVVIGILMSVSTVLWVSSDHSAVQVNTASIKAVTEESIERLAESGTPPNAISNIPVNPGPAALPENDSRGQGADTEDKVGQQLSFILNTVAGSRTNENKLPLPSEEIPAQEGLIEEESAKQIRENRGETGALAIEEKVSAGHDDESAPTLAVSGEQMTNSPSDTSGRNKQKAVVELPGAEEEQTREAQAVVQKEHASDKTEHVATPRLSLLLSFAPDFSGTSMGLSSAPGKAFGAMLHYHPFERWSISAGVVKNQKQYTGSGEDYKPPKGYWKSYTNGVIPETIDGSCDIVEFPIMIQYTAIQNGRNRWNAAVGLSSYLMQSESYRYNFDQPNPGARDGWDSKRSSRFMFSMLNFAIGYERQILPGLMLGIEPYAKIPLEEIGWSNLKLFSSGASITLRYTILRKNSLSVPTRSRGPD